MNPIDSVEAADLKKGLPRLSPGDTVRVHVRVKETSREGGDQGQAQGDRARARAGLRGHRDRAEGQRAPGPP